MRLATLLLSTIACVPGAVAAQDRATPATDNQAIGTDDIIVTARRREENLQDVPISITAIGEKTIENLHVSDVQDLEILEPSFSVSPASGYPNKPVYSLRGIRPTEAVYGQDPTVAIYMADVVQSPSQGSNLGFYDLANIQVLKGPQGTLFGRNTVSGAILLTPRKPGRDFGGNLMVGVGSFGLVETELGIDIPVNETLRVRVAGRTIDSSGYQTNVAPGPLFGSKLGGEETRSVRVTVVGDLSPTITNTLIVTYDSKKTNGRGTTIQAANSAHPFLKCYDGPTNPNGACRPGESLPDVFAAVERARNRDVTEIESDVRQYDNVSAWSITNTSEAELSDTLKIKAILAYRQVDTALTFDGDGTAIPDILTNINQSAELEHYSSEIQLQGSSFDNRLDWVTGFYYYHEEGVENSPGNFFKALLPISPIEQTGAVDNSSLSVFAQGAFKIMPELTLTAGARMNWDKRRMTLTGKTALACSLAVDNGSGGLRVLPRDACVVNLSKSFSQPTGTVSLDYQAARGLLFYATSRLGYRSGGFNLRADIPAEYAPFRPETVIDAEFGMKADWHLGGIGMRSNVSVYQQWYDDIQRTVAVDNAGGSPGSSVVNAAKAQVFGIEVQQTIKPTDGLTLQLNYTFVKPKYKNWIEPATKADLSSTPFFFTPRHAGNASMTYEQPLGGDGGTLHFTANATYTDDVWINALHTSTIIQQHPAALLPLLQQKAFWLVDISAGWRDIGGKGIDLLGYVRNVTDKVYKTGGVQLYTGATGFITSVYGLPRTYGVQLRYRF